MTESLVGISGSSMSSQEEILVVGGTYDGGIIGLSLRPYLSKNKKFESKKVECIEEVAKDDVDEEINKEKNSGVNGIFDMVFAFKAHIASIKDMDSKGNILVTASTDETMRIYNLKTRCDSGMLTKHQGSVTYVCLSWNYKYLISCGEDKVVCIWRCSNWDPIKSFDDIHECTPISADFHPSLKLALTLDIEGNICMLNLIEGNLAAKFTVPGMEKNGQHLNRRYGLFTLIKFNISGTYYAVLSQRELIISNITDKEDWYLSSSTTDFGVGPSQITSFCWITNQIFLVGFSNGLIRILQVTKQCLINLKITFTVSKTTSDEIKNPHLGNRIKGICMIGYNHLKDENLGNSNICGKLVTCDSSGIFVLFNFKLKFNKEIGNNLCELEIMDILDSDNRITCMAIEDKNPIDPLSLFSPSTSQENSESKVDKGCLSSTPTKGNKKLKVIKKYKLDNSKKKDNLKQ
ncbi:Uncharacterized protein CTYZ_00004019 [Cryptosporidium tyzzeri]|nr:Uncharacterized protein CTYZ_00004019 [Cryptosporidium tyzzeri]